MLQILYTWKKKFLYSYNVITTKFHQFIINTNINVVKFNNKIYICYKIMIFVSCQMIDYYNNCYLCFLPTTQITIIKINNVIFKIYKS